MSDGWTQALHALGPMITGALLGTVPLALASFSLGLALALGVALMRLSRHRLLVAPARAYVSVIRGTPLLVQLFVVFYGLPAVGIVIPPWPSAILAFSLNVAGYAAETVRAAVAAVPRGQWDAAYMMGMSHTMTLRKVVLPQAARIAVPPLSNSFIALVKDTSLASLVLVTELFRRAQQIAAFTQDFMRLYLEAALVYWAVCLALSAGQSALEKRLTRYAV